jgi:hypothetical protein
MIIGGIMVPVAGKFNDFKKWLLPTVIAFFIFGLVQTLYSAPSQLKDYNDVAGLRPMLVLREHISRIEAIGMLVVLSGIIVIAT